jgi:hypothetical protein
MTDPLKSDQWQAALQIAQARFAETPPINYGYNEGQEPVGGPIIEDGVMTWTGNTMDRQRMDATRQAFIDAQEHSVCEHGRAWRDGDGEITTLEYVPFYRMCVCCSRVRKQSEYEAVDAGEGARSRDGGDGARCSVCVHDELVLDDRSDEALDAMIAARGWEPISFEEARELDEQDRLLGYAMAVRYPDGAATESLWRSDQAAAEAVERTREHHERQRQQYIDAGRAVPKYIEEAITHWTEGVGDKTMVCTRSGLLISMAHERLAALEGEAAADEPQ